MGKLFKLYNLTFLYDGEFEPFTVDGYTFTPIKPNRSQDRNIYSSSYILNFNRKMHLNALVSIPKKQKNSIFREGGIYSPHRKIKFLNDILIIISICIGRNVVPRFLRNYNEFPLCSAKHCEIIADNSNELKTFLEYAISDISRVEWQQKYDNGFHVTSFYNASNILVLEQRYLADISLWEFLYYCNNRTKTYGTLKTVTLNSKINFVIKEYILDGVTTIPEEKFRIFSDIRNQLSHSGRFRIKNPSSPFRDLGWVGHKKYMKLFQRLTQLLILRTIGIDAIEKMKVFAVKADLEELYNESLVQRYHDLDTAGIEVF